MYDFVAISSDESGFSITVDTINFSSSGLFTFTVEAKLDNYYPAVPLLSAEFFVQIEPPVDVWTPPIVAPIVPKKEQAIPVIIPDIVIESEPEQEVDTGTEERVLELQDILANEVRSNVEDD